MARRRAAFSQGRVPRGTPLILCILGTHGQPFERALDWFLPLGSTDELVVQHGHTPPRHGALGVRWEREMPSGELIDLVRQADAVVAHGGVGTLMMAQSVDIVPVVIARRKHLGEHVDDHQIEIANEFAAAGYAICCRAPGDLPALVAEAQDRRAPANHQRGGLIDAVIEAAGGTPTKG